MGGTDQPVHSPVLKQELLELLDLSQSDTVIDATFGFGGHAKAVLQQLGSRGSLIGFERDKEVFSHSISRFGDEKRVKLYNQSYGKMAELLSPGTISAIYFDLGICSFHLDHASRGFSFKKLQDPFDLRFAPGSSCEPAWQLVARSSYADLRRILQSYGELRFARPVARALALTERLKTVGEVVEIVRNIVPPHLLNKELARLFQAFRIVVNQELETLEQGLESAFHLLKPSGRMAVISFHSLEDRIVKRYFRRLEKACLCPPEIPVCACDKTRTARLLNRSPVIPKEQEVDINPRARSAKLRAVKKL